MLNSGLSRGWAGWQEMLAERAAAMEAMRRGLMFMSNGKLAMCFNTWLLAIQRRTDDPIKDEVMSRALRHLINRNMSRGMLCWASMWRESCRTREAMWRSMSHMLNRGLSKGWKGWLDMMAERQEKLAAMRKSLTHMLKRELARGLTSWAAMASKRGRRAKAILATMLRNESIRIYTAWGKWLQHMVIGTAAMEAMRRGL
eukprot:3956328-Prymnesium_polylepis.1